MTKALFFGALACALAGCSVREDEEPLLNADGTTNLNRVVFAVVDGKPLTAKTVKDMVLILDRITELKQKKPLVKKDRWALDANNKAMRISQSMLSTYLIDAETRRLGLKASEQDCLTVVSNYNRMARQKAKSLDELAPLFGEQEKTFREQFARECRFAAYKREVMNLDVTDADLDRYFHSKSNALARSNGINEKANAKGLAAWNELKAGVSWETVAKKYNEDAELDPENADYWKEWIETRPQDMGLKEVREALYKLKPGEFSKPLDTDEGLTIVKVLKIDEEGRYSLARILIRLAYLVEIPEREEARREIYASRLRNTQLTLIEELKEKAKIDYPLGTNFYYRIWPLPESVEKKLKRSSSFGTLGN